MQVGGMPFSSLHDPADLARAGRILDTAWAMIERCGIPTFTLGRTDLAYIVVALLGSPGSDEQIAKEAVARFIQGQEGRGEPDHAGEAE